MAFPMFQREGAPQAQLQGRQEKQYFVPGEIGFVVRTSDRGAVPEDLSQFVFEELTAKNKELSPDAPLQSIITALQNKATHRVSGLPGMTTLFVPVPDPVQPVFAAQQAANPDGGGEGGGVQRSIPLNDDALLDAIQQINEQFYKANPTDDENNVSRIAAAAPNWLSGAQQGIPTGTGGPGGLPVLATAPGAGLHMPVDASAKLEEELDEFVIQQAPEVNVYILDTAPSLADVENQRIKYSAANLGNTLIPLVFGAGNAAVRDDTQAVPYETTLSWGDQFTIHYDMTREPNPPNMLLMDILVNRQPVAREDAKLHVDGGYYLPGHDYDMSDHGLFIASVIAQQYQNFFADIQAGKQVNNPGQAVARPRLNIHLIQVLSNFGVGTMESFVNGLAKVIKLQQGKNGPAIVNCSWVLSAPNDLDHMAYLIQAGVGLTALEHRFVDSLVLANNQALPLGEHYFDYVDYLRGILALREHLEFMRKNNLALVIACAGNDRVGTQPRPSARHPAAYEEVVGVTSLSTTGNINTATYANIADDPSNVGFAVWGGDNTTTGVAAEDETIYFTDANNSLVGLYFDDNFPDALGNKNSDPAADLKPLYYGPLGLNKPVPAAVAASQIVPNSHGLAHWSGTSFATPVMSGLFAATLGWHWDTASNRNFSDAQKAIVIASNARTLQQEMIIPMA